jgi:hypothetical protein
MIIAKVQETLDPTKFQPITIELTITDQDSLDKLSSLVNCSAVCRVVPELTEALFTILIGKGGNSCKYVNKYLDTFQK